MNRTRCTEVRALLPERARGALGAEDARLVDRHVATCAECAAELSVVRWLQRSTPAVPDGLSSRVRAALAPAAGERDVVAIPLAGRRAAAGAAAGGRAAVAAPTGAVPANDGTPGRGGRLARFRFRLGPFGEHPAWAVASAAALVAALGTAFWMRGSDVPSEVDLWQAFVEDSESMWVTGDGLVAGAPVVDELTDEEIAVLLEELEG